MQDKKNQHILFSKTISVKQHERLSKLLKKYPYSLNLQYKAVETAILLDETVDKLEYKRLSTYAIDKPFLKMKFKNIHRQSGDPIQDIETSPNIEKTEEPAENTIVDPIKKPISIEKPDTEANLIIDNPVKQDVNEQNIMMAPKKDEQERADQAPESLQFIEWLEGLNKSKRISEEKEKEDLAYDDTQLKKKKGKKKKKKKKKAQDKYAKYIEFGTKQDEIISETLAELMAKQGYTDKAIEMYNRLSLLFPDKNTYFARKIEDLRK